MRTPLLAVVGLGSNLGQSCSTLRMACSDLDQLTDTRLVRRSRLYGTPAWGNRDQPDFINAAALLETSLSPRDLLDGLLAIERDHGRLRADDGSDRWGPRTLDLDLLLYGQKQIDQPGLRVPHPHLHERAFALLPLLEIWPDAIIPGIGPAHDALAGIATDGIEAVT